MSTIEKPSARFTKNEIKKTISEVYGIKGSVRQLESYIDQNFHITDQSGKQFVFKIANLSQKKDELDAQIQSMKYVAKHSKAFHVPRVVRASSGEEIAIIQNDRGDTHFTHMLTYLDGTFLSDIESYPPEFLYQFGKFLGSLDKVLKGFDHPATHRDLPWDLKNALHAYQRIASIENPRRRSLVEYFLLQFETFVMPVLPTLRRTVIHNDANDTNVLLKQPDSANSRISGLIDFGDVVYTHTVFELAIATAYMMLNKAEPIMVTSHIVRGYHDVFPLTTSEVEILYYLICARLCISVTMSAYQHKLDPHNEYVTHTEKSAWDLLEKLIEINPERGSTEFKRACYKPVSSRRQGMSHEKLIAIRQQHIGKNLSVSYQKPLKIIGGAMQYLYDDAGKTYLDAVNNVPHVGHCHPRVVKAAQRQMAILNTNTRYLHDSLVSYAQRLISTMPDPLSVCFFVCTGSEANDLALRLARTRTRCKDVIVVDGAYHGTTTSDIEISPYKFDGPGGAGSESHIHKVPMPDIYRGIYKANDPEVSKKYAEHVLEAIQQMQNEGKNIAAFICESLLGCGGQIVLPENYLKEAFRHVRNAGGVCIIDEVQVGFGRVGTHFWGFETQDVVPDIVTLGKPIGNGHPLAAVITTPEIAESFNDGMEYFNTYGGNPVSCAAGLAVLDVIEEEKLQENALNVGKKLKKGLQKLMAKHSIIGDVRGLGLFIGVELVLNRLTLAPAPEQAVYIIERLKEKGILISTDGPLHNVLKIKPPLVFTEANADLLVDALDEILSEDALRYR